MDNPSQPDESQNPPEPNPPEQAPPQYTDWREMRRAGREARRQQRRAWRGSRPYGWVGGAVLILLGVIFLLQNVFSSFLVNWWALFILIPALGVFAGAWSSIQANGRLTASARGSLIFAIALTLAAFAFLLNLNISIWGPVLLIIAGVALLLSALAPA